MSKKNPAIVTTQPLNHILIGSPQILPLKELEEHEPLMCKHRVGKNYIQFTEIPLHVTLDKILSVYTQQPYDPEKHPDELELIVVYEGGIQVDIRLYCEDASTAALIILDHLDARSKITDRLKEINGNANDNIKSQSQPQS